MFKPLDREIWPEEVERESSAEMREALFSFVGVWDALARCCCACHSWSAELISVRVLAMGP